MSIKSKLQNNKFVMSKYKTIKNRRSCNSKYIFTNRSKDKKDLCIILAGYKELVWNEFFNRIKKFTPDNIDICIVSSGVYN